MARFSSAEDYLAAHPDWVEILEVLRAELLALDLEEAMKWSMPTYGHAGRNVVSLVAFKDYAGLWFHEAEDHSDPDGVLQTAPGGKSKTMKQWRFAKPRDVKKRALRSYLKEAMQIAAAGPAKKKPKASAKLELPGELADALKKSAPLRKAFDALSPGKQREYARHIAEAKREATRASRLCKIVPMILNGLGLSDSYRTS